MDRNIMRVLLIFLLSCYIGSDSYKILVYNMKFAHSHSNFIGNIADILVDAGHNVTSLIPEVKPVLADGTINTRVIRIPAHPDAIEVYRKLDNGTTDIFGFSELNPFISWLMSIDSSIVFTKQCEKTLDSGIADELQTEKFDLYIVESFDVCGMMLAHIIQPRAIIQVSTTILQGTQYDELGVPLALSYNPSTLTRNLDVHSFTSRLWNLYAEWSTRFMFAGPRRDVVNLFKQRFGEEYPSLKDISSNVAYVLTNTEPLIDFATPTLSKVIDIGGLGAKEPKELDEYWASVMNRRPKAVLISFGSMLMSYLIVPWKKAELLKVISSFPDVTFIWKYEKLDDEFALEYATKVDNLVLSEWMPQNDLLNHPNLAVFITHGGMGSVQELAHRGKPAIFIPLIGDNGRNSAMMEHNKLGKVLSKFDVGNHRIIVDLLRELMENPEYMENTQRIARMLAKKPFTSKEKLLRYVNFAAEFGPSPSLRPQSLDMTFIEYHNLDIIVVSLALSFITMYFTFNATARVLRNIFTNKIKKE